MTTLILFHIFKLVTVLCLTMKCVVKIYNFFYYSYGARITIIKYLDNQHENKIIEILPI